MLPKFPRSRSKSELKHPNRTTSPDTTTPNTHTNLIDFDMPRERERKKHAFFCCAKTTKNIIQINQNVLLTQLFTRNNHHNSMIADKQKFTKHFAMRIVLDYSLCSQLNEKKIKSIFVVVDVFVVSYFGILQHQLKVKKNNITHAREICIKRVRFGDPVTQLMRTKQCFQLHWSYQSKQM